MLDQGFKSRRVGLEARLPEVNKKNLCRILLDASKEGTGPSFHFENGLRVKYRVCVSVDALDERWKPEVPSAASCFRFGRCNIHMWKTSRVLDEKFTMDDLIDLVQHDNLLLGLYHEIASEFKEK